MGAFNGALSSVAAPSLAAAAIRGALERANVAPAAVEELFVGCVLAANVGQAPARQAALLAGLPASTVCTTVNKVCASGMKAIMLAAQQIRLGYCDVVVAGGMENMSSTPYYLEKARQGYRMGHGAVVDGMIKDGLWDPGYDCHMGEAAEQCADKYNITREHQDEYSLRSFSRAVAAKENGYAAREIVPVKVEGRRGTVTSVSEDESAVLPNEEKLRSLRPAFRKTGTVTAANASTISDGAAAVVLMSEERAVAEGVEVLAYIVGQGDACQDPMEFTTTPALAAEKALKDSGLRHSDMDAYEINEAFSVVALVNMQLMGISPEKTNLFGGGVSLGHPIGCSGCRIVVTLLNVLEQINGTYGCAAICNGGGGASALVLERKRG